MKVLHIITGLNDGGAEGVLYRLCQHDTSDHHMIVSLSGWGKYGYMLMELGITVIALGMHPGRPSPIAFIRLVWILLRHRPDVVQTWMYHADLFGGIATRLAGIKNLVWGIRHTALELGKSKRSTIWIAKILAKLSWWMPARIAVCARRAMDAHELLGYNREKMRFIPNGFDLAHFKPSNVDKIVLRRELKLDPTIPLIGMVGRLDPQKDHANLLKALAFLHSQGVPFQSILVGVGLEASNTAFVEKIKALDLFNNVQLLGCRNDIPQVMNMLDLHVLSSMTEAFPNVVAEAMACGTPCVVTNVGETNFIVGDSGWIVPPRNAVALADAIKDALSEWQTPKWQERCVATRKRIEEHFSIERMVISYRMLWTE